MITGQDLSNIPKGKRPGPKRTPCPHCGLVDCSHCRCPGTPLCCHAGKMCGNHRYRRRLVCNPCEKNRIKYQTSYAKYTGMPLPMSDVMSESRSMSESFPSSFQNDNSMMPSSYDECDNSQMLFPGSFSNTDDVLNDMSRSSSVDISMDNNFFSPRESGSTSQLIEDYYYPNNTQFNSDNYSTNDSCQNNISQENQHFSFSQQTPSSMVTIAEDSVILPPVTVQSMDLKRRHCIYICTAHETNPFGFIMINPNSDTLRYVRKYIETHYEDTINRTQFVFVNIQGHVIMDDKEPKILCWKESELRQTKSFNQYTNNEEIREFRCLYILTIPKHISEKIQDNLAKMLSPPISSSSSSTPSSSMSYNSSNIMNTPKQISTTVSPIINTISSSHKISTRNNNDMYNMNSNMYMNNNNMNNMNNNMNVNNMNNNMNVNNMNNNMNVNNMSNMNNMNNNNNMNGMSQYINSNSDDIPMEMDASNTIQLDMNASSDIYPKTEISISDFIPNNNSNSLYSSPSSNLNLQSYSIDNSMNINDTNILNTRGNQEGYSDFSMNNISFPHLISESPLPTPLPTPINTPRPSISRPSINRPSIQTQKPNNLFTPSSCTSIYNSYVNNNMNNHSNRHHNHMFSV
ncbi:hypothetical protein WA158_008541 [Blastocystis sp. Blastoise]